MAKPKRASTATVRRMKVARRAWDRATRKARVAERRYAADLADLAAEIGAVYARFLGPALAKVAAKKADAVKGPAGAASGNVKADIAKLRKSLEKQIAPRVELSFGKMAKAVDDASKEYAVLVGFRPIDVSEALDAKYQEALAANVDLVTAAGRDYADQVEEIFTDPANFGRRVEDLAGELMKGRDQAFQSRAELIARDQTLKTLGTLNETRQTAAGITKYVWSTSLDGAVRPEHKELEGSIQSWDSPPEPGHPGQDFQCRCSALPVIDEAEGLFGE